MTVRIRPKARLVVIRTLTCGLALSVAACASERFSHEKPAPMSRVNEAISAITDNYVDPIETSVLVNACLDKRPRPTGTIGIRQEDTGEHTVRDVAAIFAGLPPQDGDAAAESCIREMVATLDAHSLFFLTLAGCAMQPNGRWVPGQSPPTVFGRLLVCTTAQWQPRLDVVA
jgi:hypothetical protein